MSSDAVERTTDEEFVTVSDCFHGYTADEWAEIEAAVSAIRPNGVPSSLRWQVMMTTVHEIGHNPKESRGLYESLEEEMRDLWNIVKALDDRLRPLIEDGFLSEGRWERNTFGEHYEKALPHLMMIAHFAARRGAEYGVKAERAQAKAAGKNAKNWFRESFFNRVARRWEGFGGEVRQTREYRRFFEAVVRPVYYSDFGKNEGLDGWNDAAWPDDNPIFREHAKAYMKAKGTPPSRGRRTAKKVD